MQTEKQIAAYQDGLASGRQDYLLGRMNAYAYYGTLDHPSTYSHQYALGYRYAWHESDRLKNSGV